MRRGLDNMPPTDYQRQPAHVRVYRWLRYRPLGFLRGCVGIAVWAITSGCKPFSWSPWDDEPPHTMTREATFWLVWSGWDTSWIYMGHSHNVKDVLASLKAAPTVSERVDKLPE